MSNSAGGRPTKMTEENLKKLEEIFMVNGTDEDACFYAGISPRTLYNYQEEHPEYLQRKRSLKNMPRLKAKKVLMDKLGKNDKQVAQFILEHTDHEYKNKSHVEVDSKQPLIQVVTDKQKQTIEDL